MESNLTSSGLLQQIYIFPTATADIYSYRRFPTATADNSINAKYRGVLLKI